MRRAPQILRLALADDVTRMTPGSCEIPAGFSDVPRKELLSELVQIWLALAGPRVREMSEFYLLALIALLLSAVVVALMNLGSDGLQR